MTRYFLTLAILAIALSLNAQFTDLNLNLHGVYWGEAEWGDYDSDGDLDFVISGYSPSVGYLSRIYRNDGNDVFININANLVNLQWSSVAWGDYDNDGDLDLILSGLDAGNIFYTRIYRNDGSDIFTDINIDLPGIQDGDIAWADYDNDGKLDFILCGMIEGGFHFIEIFHNDGFDQFSQIQTNFPQIRHPAFSWGDYDRDGDLDLILCGYLHDGNYTTKVYRNDGNGVFVDINAGLLNVYNSCVRWGDYNNDGFLDILLAGQYHQDPHLSATKVYRNNGNGTFTDINAGIIDVSFSSTEWGDFDNDGYLDVVLCGRTYTTQSTSTSVYRNNGDGTFSLYSNLVPGEGGNIIWGDYDNDGDLDILHTGSGNPFYLRIYRNDTIIPNSAPTIPSGLNTTTDNNFVTFSWSPSNDIQTPVAALTYELRIGTSPGASDILKPMSISNGKRQVPQFGRALSTCSWKIKASKLKAQNNYYWSVQAIDGAYTGSAFATERVFSNIRVITPNGGEAYYAGSVAQITWSAAAWVDSIIILFSADNGAHWNWVDNVVLPASQGTYYAQTPNMITNQCLIRVVNAADQAIFDQSDAVFSFIADPPLQPENVQININEDSVLLTWDPVTQTQSGNPFTPSYYLVFFNGTGNADGTYYYLGRSYVNSILHDGAVLHTDNMFYRVKAFRHDRSSDREAIFIRLNSKMTEAEVMHLLEQTPH